MNTCHNITTWSFYLLFRKHNGESRHTTQAYADFNTDQATHSLNANGSRRIDNRIGRRHSLFPSEFIVTSPHNSTYQTNSITLDVNVTTASWVLNSVYYKADWLDNSYHCLYYVGNSQVSAELARAITIETNFTNIPTGNHTINIIANYHDDSHAYDSVSFAISNVPS